MKAIYALFGDPESAQRGVDLLHNSKSSLHFDDGQIVVITSEPYNGYDFAEEHGKSPMWALATMGGVLGGLCGYWLTLITQKAYPLPTGGMPIVPPWTNGIIVYELAMLGAILTTLIALVVETRLPSFGARLSDPEIWMGKILVGVMDPPETAKGDLEKWLRQAGALKVKAVSGEYTRAL